MQQKNPLSTIKVLQRSFLLLVFYIAATTVILGGIYALSIASRRVDSLLNSLAAAFVVLIAAWLGFASWYKADISSTGLLKLRWKLLGIIAAIAIVSCIPLTFLIGIFLISDLNPFYGLYRGYSFTVGFWFGTWLPLNILSAVLAAVFGLDLKRLYLPKLLRSVLLIVTLMLLSIVTLMSIILPFWD